MKKIKLIAVIGIIMMMLVSCGSAKSKIVGHWQHDNSSGLYDLEFFSDGTYTSKMNNYYGNYSIDGNRLKLSGVLVSDIVYSFEFDGDTLILYKDSDNEHKYPTEYERVD